MSPTGNEHGIYQAKIIALMSQLMDKGTLIAECSIQTSEGVKVADVAWATDEFMRNNQGNNPYAEAPEICVEILPPSNSELEMGEKKELYFARGAKEFWVCDKDGNIKFYKNTGLLEKSHIIEAFPGKV